MRKAVLDLGLGGGTSWSVSVLVPHHTPANLRLVVVDEKDLGHTRHRHSAHTRGRASCPASHPTHHAKGGTCTIACPQPPARQQSCPWPVPISFQAQGRAQCVCGGVRGFGHEATPLRPTETKAWWLAPCSPLCGAALWPCGMGGRALPTCMWALAARAPLTRALKQRASTEQGVVEGTRGEGVAGMPAGAWQGRGGKASALLALVLLLLRSMAACRALHLHMCTGAPAPLRAECRPPLKEDRCGVRDLGAALRSYSCTCHAVGLLAARHLYQDRTVPRGRRPFSAPARAMQSASKWRAMVCADLAPGRKTD